MGRIGVVTEETADLPQEIVSKYKIAVIPVILNWPEIKELPGDNTFQKMRELDRRGIKSFGKTSQPSPEDFLAEYKNQLERFDSILCVTLTSKLSGSHNSAVLAKSLLNPEDQGRVFIVDSLNATCGQALIVLKAIDLIESGKGTEVIQKELEEFVQSVHFFMMFEDPKWLEASGRISHLVANMMRGMARIGVRPLLTFRRGTLAPVALRTHAKDIAGVLFRQLVKETERPRKEGKRIRIAITHGDNIDGAQRLREMVEEYSNIDVAFINVINNVVGAPTGPNTIGFAWCEI